MSKSHNRIIQGFTLIELMVVISIIGMLSSVMMVSLKNARNKALDAKIKAQLRNLRTAADLYKATTGNGGYGNKVLAQNNDTPLATIANGCRSGMFADPKIAPYVAIANYPLYVRDSSDPSDGSSNTLYARCAAMGVNSADPDANRFFVVVRLSTGGYYCIDSVGGPVEKLGDPTLERSYYSETAVVYAIRDCNQILTSSILSL